MPSAALTSTHSPDWQKLDFNHTAVLAARPCPGSASVAAGELFPEVPFSLRDIGLFIAFLKVSS